MIVTSSVEGVGTSTQSNFPYSASKAGVIHLAKHVAKTLAPDHITVNCIAPGPFLTDMMNHIRHDAERMSEYLKTIPLERCGEEDDIKGAVTFLASPAAAFVTGAILVVDGGLLSR